MRKQVSRELVAESSRPMVLSILAHELLAHADPCYI